jgi:hypothetical protein
MADVVLAPTILAIWEAEVRRIVFQGQSKHKKVIKTPTPSISQAWRCPPNYTEV